MRGLQNNFQQKFLIMKKRKIILKAQKGQQRVLQKILKLWLRMKKKKKKKKR